MTEQTGKTALVTGGNRGIGLAIVEGLAELGLHVLMGSRRLHDGMDATSAIEGKVTPVALDLSDRGNLSDQVDEIITSYPTIDVLVNNAGILAEGDLLEVSPEEFTASLRINVEAPFELIQRLVPGMRTRGYGRIVNVSSGWGSFDEGLSGPAAYSVSKAALNALTVTLTQSVSGSDVKANAMCPGWVRTRMGGAQASRSPKKGAETAIWLATLEADGPTAGFFRDKSPIDW